MAVSDELTESGGTAAKQRRLRIVLRAGAFAAVAVFAVFVAGFFYFMSSIAQFRAEQAASPADAIVVLTGGVARIDAGLKLLEENKGRRLLISGVHPSTSRDLLRKTYATSDTRFRCCVDVDRAALDTVGNAEETAMWAARNGFDSLIVVTNDYHMPRSLLEMRRHMRGVNLIPYAVVTGSREITDPVDLADRYRVLFGEYVKYGAAQFRSVFEPLTAADTTTRRAALSAEY